MMAKACMDGEKLGHTPGVTDFMAISLSSTDYCGHQFGPNSVEIEDMFLRLDREIASFLKYMDRVYGKGNYLMFLTADHGAAHNPEFLQDEDLPAGVFNVNFAPELQDYLYAQFKVKKEIKMDPKTHKPLPNNEALIRGYVNYQFYLDDSFMVKYKMDREKVKGAMIGWLKKRKEIEYVIDMENPHKTSLPEPIQTMVTNGYYEKRCGVILTIPNPAWYENGGRTSGTTHGTWNPYDTHIPLIWYGWHIHHGESETPVNMTDIAPTVAALLHIQMPNGCIGKPIPELFRKH
jgi:arylsulfatase A-like enzyme